MSIVNRPSDDKSHQSEESMTSWNLFNRFKQQNFGYRELKKAASQINFWNNPNPLISQILANPVGIHNLGQTSNDHVDTPGTGASHDAPIGAANGFMFARPAKVSQSFKTFGIRLGKFGSLYGTGAFMSHNEYPHEIRW